MKLIAVRALREIRGFLLPVRVTLARCVMRYLSRRLLIASSRNIARALLSREEKFGNMCGGEGKKIFFFELIEQRAKLEREIPPLFNESAVPRQSRFELSAAYIVRAELAYRYQPPDNSQSGCVGDGIDRASIAISTRKPHG